MPAQIQITFNPALMCIVREVPFLATERENEGDCGLHIKQLVGVPGYTTFLSALSAGD